MKKSKGMTLAWILLIAAVFLTILDICSFDRAFYEKEYAKNHTAEVIDISDEELMKVTNHLLGYLQDETEVLKISAVIVGNDRNVFDERDTLHMIDVKILYKNAMRVRTVSLLVSLMIFGFNFIRLKKDFLISLAASFYKALGIYAAVCAAVLIAAAIDFDSLWRLFHRIFFTNDLWLLDPNVSVLINMVPLQFFFDLVTKIVLLFISFLAVCSSCFLMILKKAVKE